MPKVALLLGVGDAVAPTQVPRWLRYPYLRLAHLVETGTFCTEFGIQAAKVPYGGPQLTSAAFGVQRSEIYADNLASYVSSDKNFNSDLGALIYQSPSIFRSILLFRASADGESFRRETSAALATGSAREFSASVNAGLSRTIPLNILQRAHDRMLALMTASPQVVTVPAVWSNVQQDDSITRLWRVRSEKLLSEICRSRGIKKNDSCVCGSGEKLRLCCLAPLRR